MSHETSLTTPPLIFLLENDLGISQTLEMLLECEGYASRSAGTTREAVQILRHSPVPALLLVDPDHSADETWEFLAGRAGLGLERVPLIVFSHLTRELELKWTGVTEWLPKPFEMDQLLGLLARHAPLDFSMGNEAGPG